MLYISSQVAHKSSNAYQSCLFQFVNSYLSVTFCDVCFHVNIIRTSPGVSGVSYDTPCRCVGEESDYQTFKIL